MIAVTATPAHRIDRRIQGQFVEHLGRGVYEGLWVGTDSDIPHKNGIRSDVVAALRRIRVPLVRWPGGCFADDYHWMAGIGPERRPMVNSNWGATIDPGTFGTHEYFELLQQLDAEAYVNGNVGTGSVAEMRDWVEYMTLESGTPLADLRERHGRAQPWSLEFFGVGNESWGCGGNMRAEQYTALYRHYQTFVRDYRSNHVQKIACGADSDNYHWTDVLMSGAADFMDGLSLHYYTLPTGQWEPKGSATGFTEQEWNETLRRARHMEDLVVRHGRVMDRYDPQRRVAMIVDEWGTWYDREPEHPVGSLFQQNTMRDAMVAAITFNIFHRHAHRVRMANIAQMVNVLQAMILTDGPRMVTTPTYHVFDLYSDHQDAEALVTREQHPGYPGRAGQHGDYTASRKGEVYTISVANTSWDEEDEVAFELPGQIADVTRADLLTAAEPGAHNTFEAPEQVAPRAWDGYRVTGERLTLSLPPHSVVSIGMRVA